MRPADLQGFQDCDIHQRKTQLVRRGEIDLKKLYLPFLLVVHDANERLLLETHLAGT